IGLQLSDVDFGAVGEEAFITDTNTRDTGVFVVERLDFGAWGLEGGARFEQREHDNVIAGAREFESWSGSAGVFFRPAESWFLGVTVAHTERAPTAVELFSDGLHLATESYEVGNADLSTETALSLEGSIRYDRGPISAELNLYRIAFEDYIALVDTGVIFFVDEVGDTEGFSPPDAIPVDAEEFGVFAFNQQDATFEGGELVLRARLFETNGVRVSTDLGYDWVRASFDDGGHPPRIPPASLTLGLDAESEHWSGRVEMVDVAEQDRLAAFETATDGYTFINASLAFRPQGEDGMWQVRLDGRNLGDELGRVHSSFLKNDLALPGRNFRVTLLANF
ncbi:MAG: TonB-dependent receptor, partial [Hyphomonadaceae bacterium]|nr:TonB-dependent receptor [Hyphomonadaceae bacterium]